ncbi:hypothetical protein MUP65_01585 [Patescibacteria group bacterium]|nr:hypothetical protein [Patescibacteria group bacterium]
MNQLQSGLEAVLQKVNQAERGTILISAQPSLDLMAAALSLYLGLKKGNKDFRVVCTTPTTVGFSHLVGVDKVAQRVSGKSLIVSFDYQQESIDKISYNINEGKFNLVVQPKPGAEPLPTKNVSYSYGGESGLLVVIGAQSLTDLGMVYEQNKGVFEKGSVMSITVGQPANFGQPRLSFADSSSYSEGVLSILRNGNLRVDEDMASNLLQGLYQVTQGLAVPGLTAETFETVAFCVRLGGLWPIQTGVIPKAEVQRVGDFQPMPATESAARPPQQIETKESSVKEGKTEGVKIPLPGAKGWSPKFPSEGRNA